MLTTWNTASTLDRMFNDVMGASLGTATNSRTFSPEVDVRATETEVLLMCEVPGVKREDIDITLENRMLTIKGEKKFESTQNEQIVLGRSYGSFTRQIALPTWLDESNLSANLADGVLTVGIPKHPKAKPVKIQIGHGSESKQLSG